MVPVKSDSCLHDLSIKPAATSLRSPHLPAGPCMSGLFTQELIFQILASLGAIAFLSGLPALPPLAPALLVSKSPLAIASIEL